MTPARFRKLALALEGVTEVPHMDRAAFRTKRKIFATMKGGGVNLLVEPEEQREALVAAFPDVFASLGGWSRLGWLAVTLSAASDDLLMPLLADAHRGALPKVATRRAKAKGGATRVVKTKSVTAAKRRRAKTR